MAAETTEPTRLVLLPSPLLGPAVWQPVAGELRRRGWDVLVPPAYSGVATPGDVLAHLLAAVSDEAPVVLVPHSNAGLYVAGLAVARQVRGIVFVDARLPDAGPAAETPFRQFLATLADEQGILPPWTQWWPEDEVTALFPDAATEAAVTVEQVRLPLSYFDAPVSAPPGWDHLPAAYLGFGDAYAAEQATARERGWPVRRLGGRHLHPVVDPVGVSDALVGLLGQMGFEGS